MGKEKRLGNDKWASLKDKAHHYFKVEEAITPCCWLTEAND